MTWYNQELIHIFFAGYKFRFNSIFQGRCCCTKWNELNVLSQVGLALDDFLVSRRPYRNTKITSTSDSRSEPHMEEGTYLPRSTHQYRPTCFQMEHVRNGTAPTKLSLRSDHDNHGKSRFVTTHAMIASIQFFIRVLSNFAEASLPRIINTRWRKCRNPYPQKQ